MTKSTSFSILFYRWFSPYNPSNASSEPTTQRIHLLSYPLSLSKDEPMQMLDPPYLKTPAVILFQMNFFLLTHRGNMTSRSLAPSSQSHKSMPCPCSLSLHGRLQY